jgi:hypothetical protein
MEKDLHLFTNEFNTESDNDDELRSSRSQINPRHIHLYKQKTHNKNDIDVDIILQKIEEGRVYIRNFEEIVKKKGLDKVTLLIGCTGAAKTTTAYLLSNHQLKVVKNNYGDLIIVGGPAIQDSVSSGTTLPNLMYDNDKLFIIDFPGLNDNRGAGVDILNSYYAREIFNLNLKKKLIFVVREDDFFQTKTTSLISSLKCLYDLLGDCEKFKDSIILLVTAVQHQPEQIKNRVKNDILKDEYLYFGKGKILL